MSYLKYSGAAATETAAPSVNNYGAAAVETMTGGAGADGLWGSNNDVLSGGGGDDTYYLQGNGITVSEAVNGGVDRIVAWANTNLARTPNIENLEIGGDRTYGAGNDSDNIIIATGSGQQLYGGMGQDVLVGGSGADTFQIVKGTGSDAIYNFNAAQDVVRLTAGYTSFAQVQQHMTQVGADVKLDLGGGEGLVIRNITTAQLTAANFQLQLDPAKLGAVTFHDEFSGALSLYSAKYNPTGVWRPDYDLQGAQGVGSYTLTSNNEQQIYTSPYFRDHAGDFSESPFTSNGDGTLSIWARPSSSGELFNYHYTSGMLSSKESFAQTYGYFEMRADLPDNVGGWPAFWLLPADRSWPPELDVMEVLTKDSSSVVTTAHSNANGTHTMSQGVAFTPATTDGFHTYGVLWTKTDLTWYVDGVEVYHTATPTDMNKPMYMVANLALGGWGGTIDASQLPAEMKLDYIRTYALADGSSTVARDTAHTGGTPLPTTSTGSAGTSAGDVTSGGATSGGASSGGATSGGAASGGASSGGAASVDTAPTEVHLQGGDGPETLVGASGANVIFGGGGADRILGGTGFNRVNGNLGEDTIIGKSTVGDWLLGGQGSDQIDASLSTGHNMINGNLGSDTLTAGSGGDTLRGGQGDDLIRGGSGADWLSGDRGTDTLTGGGGADLFHHFSGAGTSFITDFNRAEGDRILLDHGSQYATAQQGADVVVSLAGGGQLVLQNTSLGALGATSGWIVVA